MFDIKGNLIKKPPRKILPFNEKLKKLARANRKAGNLSEVLLWSLIKAKNFYGIRFSRQKIIGNYIVDFYCEDLNFAIEIDGSSHANKQEYDRQRESYLNFLEIKVFRIYDTDVKFNLEGVWRGLENFVIKNYN